MRLKIIKRSVWALLSVMMLFLSCSEDKLSEASYISPDKTESSSHKSTYHLYVNLKMETSSPVRAGVEFEDGKESESKINNLLLIFYTSTGEYITHFESDKMEKSPDEEADEVPWVEKLKWNTSIELDVEMEDEYEGQVARYYAVVNYDNSILESLTAQKTTTTDDEGNSLTVRKMKSLTDLKSDIKTSSYYISKDGASYFVMTTPGHFTDEGIYEWWQNIPEDAETISKEEDFAGLSPLTVYVERLAARIDVTVDTEKISPVQVVYGTDLYYLYFTPTHYGLEGEEDTEYLTKRHGDKNSFTSAGGYPTNFYTLTDYSGKRTFWAESPYYTGGSYLSKADGSETTSLLYSSFSLIASDDYKLGNAVVNGVENQKLKTGTLYTKEHTFANTELNTTANAYSVPTSVVIYGQYTASYTGTDERPADETKTPADLDLSRGFYIREIDIEREDPTLLRYRLYLEYEMEAVYYKEQYTICKKTGEDASGNPVYMPLKDEEAGLVMGIKNVCKRLYFGQMVAAPNTFTLQIKDGWEGRWDEATRGKLYYATFDNNSNTPVYTAINSQADIDNANDALLRQLGSVMFYSGGHGFFYMPVPHFLDTTDYKGEFTTDNDDRITHYTGDFGIVRNNLYSLTVKGISTLGYGKPGENNIPLPQPAFDQLYFEFDIGLEILPWNIFEYTIDIE